MKLKAIFDQLVGSEITQACIGGQNAGVINDQNQHILINHINLGLTDLFTRFLLKEGKLKLRVHPAITSYVLSSDYAVTNPLSLVGVKYVDDAGLPFKDDLAKIHSVMTAEGEDVTVNEATDPWTIHNPSTLILEFPKEVVAKQSCIPSKFFTEYYEVTYRALHPTLEADPENPVNPSTINVELPSSYLHALLAFVASRVYGPLGQGAEASLGVSYANKYEQLCRQLESKKLDVDNSSTGVDNRFHARGWV